MDEIKYIATPSRTKEILDQFNLKAKKGFGQNFLVDPMIVKRCSELAHGQEGAVIEIGPGIGSLTQALSYQSKQVISYEVDEELIPILEETLKDRNNIEIRLQDFLEVNLQEVVKELKKKYGKVVVCANLPYYITTPILFKIFNEGKDIEWITVMVQKEVGDRFAAQPDDPQFSALSVEGQYLYNIHKLYDVPGRSFNPSPDVSSVIIQFHRLPDQEGNPDPEQFLPFIRSMFQQRRKTIYNNLRNSNYTDDPQLKLEQADIDPKKRPQSIHVDEYIKLWKVIHD